MLEADHLSGGTEADRGSAESTVGEGEEGGVRRNQPNRGGDGYFRTAAYISLRDCLGRLRSRGHSK
jgi:hypothetical protein